MSPRPLSYHETHLWALQLQVMLAAGVPLLAALKSIARSELPVVARTCEQLAQKISGGQSLSQAMRSMNPVFSPFVTNVVVVGEQSGSLIAVLERVWVRSSRRAKMESAILGAIAYPIFLAAVSIALALCMAFYMFPKLLPFLIGLGVPLPWPTRALIWFTENFSWLLLILTILAAYCGRMLAAGSDPRVAWLRNWLIYRSPVLGALNVDRVYAETLDDLYLLVAANCDLMKGLKTLRVPWPDFERRIALCIDMVRSGTGFSEAAHLSGMLPDRFAVQVKSGEESGRLAPMFRMLSDQLHESVSLKAEQIVQCMEPAILLGMGLVTGFVVVATFMPLYSMATAAL